MQRPPQAAAAPVKKIFGKLGKTKNLFSNVEFNPSSTMKKRNSGNSGQRAAGLLSDTFNCDEDDIDDDESGSVTSGMSRFSRKSRNSIVSIGGGLRIMGRKRGEHKRGSPKRGSPKRTSSQAVPGRTKNSAGFGSIHEVIQNMQDDDDQSIVSVDPFCRNERSASPNGHSSNWENLIRLSPDKTNASMSPKKKNSNSAPRRPSFLLGSSYRSNSEHSLDLFGVGVANRSSSNDRKGKDKNSKPHDSFDAIEPTVAKHNKHGRRAVPKGAKKSTNEDDDLNKRARELEEIGNIGSSEELNYNPDEDDDDDDDDDRGFGNAPQFGDDEDEFDYFEDEEASSYYSGSTGREDDDYYDQEYGPQRASRSSLPKRTMAPQSTSYRSHRSSTISLKATTAPIPRFERVLPPNHFAGFVDHGDWRALGKDANKIRKRPGKNFINNESESDTDSDSSSSSCESHTYNGASSFNHSFSQEVFSSDEDDDSVIGAADKEEVVEKKPAARRNLTRMSSFQLRQWDGFRNQVEKLVHEAMPENVDQVDKMMEQFAGREAELVQTLEKMTERAGGRRTNRVHRSRQMTGTRHTQNWQTSEAVAHIAAACTIDEGVNIDTEFWKEDVSVYSNDFLMGTNGDNNNSGSMSQIDESEESSYYSEDDDGPSDSESVYTYDDDDQSYSLDEEDKSENNWR